MNNDPNQFTHEAWEANAQARDSRMGDEGKIKTVYSVKTSRYMTNFHAKGVALRAQPRLQMDFEHLLQYYLNLGFQNGFVLDGFEERAFPPVLVAHFRKS